MPQPQADKRKVFFTLMAPKARSVALVADFTNWAQEPLELKQQKKGRWKATTLLAPGSYQYRYLVDGQWWDDQDCQTRAPNPFGGENCVRVIV